MVVVDSHWRIVRLASSHKTRHIFTVLTTVRTPEGVRVGRAFAGAEADDQQFAVWGVVHARSRRIEASHAEERASHGVPDSNLCFKLKSTNMNTGTTNVSTMTAVTNWGIYCLCIIQHRLSYVAENAILLLLCCDVCLSRGNFPFWLHRYRVGIDDISFGLVGYRCGGQGGLSEGGKNS